MYGYLIKTLRHGLFIILFLMYGTCPSQGLIPKLGEQRAATSCMTFLKISLGARAVSMGGAYVAMANDISAMIWNPAGLVQSDHHEFGISHLDWLVDTDYEFAGFTYRIHPDISVGIFGAYLHLADMTTETHPYGNGETFQYSDLVTGLTGSFRLTDRFSVGLTLKYVRETLDDLIMDGGMVDFGTYYWTGYKTLRIAAAMRNFGPNLRPDGTYARQELTGDRETEYESFSPPTLFTLGAAMDIFTMKNHTFTLSVQMNHPMDDQESYVIGSEYRWARWLALRGGMNLSSTENSWGFGMGIMIPYAGKHLDLDLSIADYAHLNTTQQLTMGIKF